MAPWPSPAITSTLIHLLTFQGGFSWLPNKVAFTPAPSKRHFT
jgi:hypothetical protein